MGTGLVSQGSMGPTPMDLLDTGYADGLTSCSLVLYRSEISGAVLPTQFQIGIALVGTAYSGSISEASLLFNLDGVGHATTGCAPVYHTTWMPSRFMAIFQSGCLSHIPTFLNHIWGIPEWGAETCGSTG